MSSILISIRVITWFIYRTIKKYKSGEVFKINFNDPEQKVEIKTVNLANNKTKGNYYSYENLSYYLNNKESSLFGKQRILKIKINDKTVHEINFDGISWYINEHFKN